jgi:hypothetical protein
VSEDPKTVAEALAAIDALRKIVENLNDQIVPQVGSGLAKTALGSAGLLGPLGAGIRINLEGRPFHMRVTTETVEKPDEDDDTATG